MFDLSDIFGHGGPLESALPAFKVRRQQLRMAERVAAAVDGRETLAVEAGTGTGKTFAYLVPALVSGARVLISTGTRTLQDQLFSKDLPLVAGALGRPVKVALLKGRSNYLCRHRLAEAGTAGEQLALDATPTASSGGNMIARIQRWALTTRSGDLSEVRGLSDSHAVWPQVTSTRENCLGIRCSEISRCHVAIARRKALESDIVVVNHHLLLADLALKEDGFGDILGSADAVILDEAHQIPDLATQFFGASVSSRRVEGVLKDLKSEVSHAPEPSEVSEAVRTVEDSLLKVSAYLPSRPTRISWTERYSLFNTAVEDLCQSIHDLRRRLGTLDEENPLAQIGERLADLTASLERITAIDELDGARAIETTVRGWTLSLMPFDISARFQAMLQARRCAWVFTSATLSLGEDFGHFTGRLGLADIPTLRIDSPFDYERQSLLYLPVGMPEPASPEFVTAVMERSLPLIEASGGGAFILFTSHRALTRGAGLLRERWAGQQAPFRLYVQGEAPRERLLKEFREDGNGVLLGTTSFWEGVDVKGEALRLVIIEKLPFASPDDPLVRARIEYLQTTGGNAFRDYQLPEAALALKQGVGRLIRSEDDFGAVVICDPRITGKGYGKVFVAALPSMNITREHDEIVRFLRSHAPRVAATHATS